MAQNPWLNLAGALVSGLADVGANEVKRHAGDYLGLPKPPQPPQFGQPPDFDGLVNGAAMDAATLPEWQDDGTALIWVAHEGQAFQAEIKQNGPFVQVSIDTDFGSPVTDFARKAALLMRRAAYVHFGGWAWRPKDGGIGAYCKVMLPADQLTGQKVHGLAKFVAKEVYEASVQLGS